MSPPSEPDCQPAGSTPPDPAAVAAELIATLIARNTELQDLVVSQASRIAELERRLGLNSSNSGKPPSSCLPRRRPGMA